MSNSACNELECYQRNYIYTLNLKQFQGRLFLLHTFSYRANDELELGIVDSPMVAGSASRVIISVQPVIAAWSGPVLADTSLT